MDDGSTKILTVSYGTFSCTLEGFDDPLGAMRDIAEYFRDLAADDRYFGAEPLTPDVEMLQNIAEKDIDRRVEARMSDAGVSLRQVEHVQETEVRPVEKPTVDDEPEPSKPEANLRAEAGAMAARVVSAAKSEDEPDQGKDSEQDGSKDALEMENDQGPLTFNDEFLMSDEPEDVLAVDPSASILDASPAESVAEKLRRIRAVVSKNVENGSAFAGDSLVEDMPESHETIRDRALTETIEAITADISDDENSDDIVEFEDADIAADDTDSENAVEASEETAWDKDAKVELDGDGVDHSDPDDAHDDHGPINSEATEDTDGADDTSENDEADEIEDEAEIEQSISDIIGNVSGRLAESGDVAEEDALEETVAEPSAVASSKADKRDGPITKPVSEDKGGDMGRLLAETDNKLNEDEVVRRRRVISQMRAAVAATKADRLVSRHVSKEVAEQEDQSPYREDLSEVVRQQSEAAPSVSRSPDSAPPLMLVSSLRVDEAEDVFEDASKSDAPVEAENFADFASTMGAKELPDLLEAAAAFTVFGEGQSSFTRPEIMKRVAAVDPTIRMSREESLRSFGQLLRQGKFRKLERGQFTIDRETRFNPKRRVAG